MSRWKNILKRWTSQSITTKFSLAFAVLLLLLFLIAVVSISALMITRRETETTIFISTHIQHLVLEMDRRLEKSRRLERDFFLHYPRIGFSAAYQQYAQPAKEQVQQVRSFSAELQNFFEQSEVGKVWQEHEISLAVYISAADRHAVTIEEAITLVSRLADETTGLQTQLAQHSSRLFDLLKTADDPTLIEIFREMLSFEKDYFIARQRPLMQSAFNVGLVLKQTIKQTPGLETVHKEHALQALEAYQTVAEEMLDLNVAIRGMFNEFDLQAQAVDPIADELITLAHQEIERIRSHVGRMSRFVTVLLVITALLGFGVAGFIAIILNNSITRNIVKLSHTAGEFQAGRLHIRAQIESDDELGQLANSFNAMAMRIDDLVEGLEQKVAERTAELTTSNRQLQQMEAELREYSEDLESMVDARTQELRDTQEALIRKEKLATLGELAGGVAHELRHPLGVLSNAVYFLKMTLTDVDKTTQEYLDIISSEVHKSEKIVSDLLGFSRTRLIEKIEREEVSISMLVTHVLAEYSPPEWIEVSTQFDSGLPPILVNPQQIRQVLANLFTNAYQAMPDGGTLTIRAKTEDDDKILIAVSDTGIGVAEEHQAKLFEPLFTTKPKGIGLGLAVCKNLVEANGGNIEVKSEEGKGSTFTLILPLKEAAQ